LKAARLLGVVVTGLLLACGAAGGGGPSPSPTPSGARTVVATDADNGRTISIKVGQRLEVRLSSTYWVFGSSSNIAVLRSAGPQVASPQPSGCVPGGGCGVVTATFDAITAGVDG
jgi:hypothetical protein